MKDTKLAYLCPAAEVVAFENEDIVCTSGLASLGTADEILTAASWKASWTEKMGLGDMN